MDPSADDCLLCTAERLTDWLHEDEDCWIAECIVCRTPMVVWRTHGLPEPDNEARLIVPSRACGGRALRRRGVLRRPRAPAHPRPLARARAPGRRLLRSHERPLRSIRRVLRERSSEEPVELRHREGRQPPLRRVQQPLVDQPSSGLCDALDRSAHLIGDGAGALRFPAELRQRAKVRHFPVGRPLEPRGEEVLVQPGLDDRLRLDRLDRTDR